MSLHDEITKMGECARQASRALALLSSAEKNDILGSMAEGLRARSDAVKRANSLDLEAGEKAGLSSAMLDRLQLTDSRFDSMVSGIYEIAKLDDPVGQLLYERERPNGLVIRKVRVPLGVIGFIYESRPNVTADTAALCVKSSNAVILRGGKEAIHSNKAISEALQDGGKKRGLPKDSVQLIGTSDRGAVKELVQLENLVDLVIPRGGEGLIRAVVDMAKVPVLKHYKGICHTYVDESADLDMAIGICENAKCQRPGVCNAMETLLVHEAVAGEFLSRMSKILLSRGVELRGDERACEILPDITAATEQDWSTEYLDLILSVRVVSGVKEAIDHISEYGSGHSDAIVAGSEEAQRAFINAVDSSSVIVNASTRFVDGGEFGLGAEIGISTDKLHARGPMGLEELTTYKYVVIGDGQIRE